MTGHDMSTATETRQADPPGEASGQGVNSDRPQLNRAQRAIASVVVGGTVLIAGISFAGSYTAVRDLATRKGFGAFATVFPLGVDAGIVVLLALDLLLTWCRIPFPLLRQTAWLLTASTITFNAAAAWPDPIGTGMHAVIPVVFVVTVEAARHAVGRIAAITADRHVESVRLARWLLAPVPTFVLWRRMQLWEIRKYNDAIKREIERLVYRAWLRSRYGRAWRRKAPVEKLLPLRLARFGVPLDEAPPLLTRSRRAVETQRPLVADALEQHFADVLDVTAGSGNEPAVMEDLASPTPLAEHGVNASEITVNGSVKDEPAPTVKETGQREPRPVNLRKPETGAEHREPGSVNSRTPASVNEAITRSTRPLGVPTPIVKDGWKRASRSTVNAAGRVKHLVSVPVNAACLTVKHRESLLEPLRVNESTASVNLRARIHVNGSRQREATTLKPTVNFAKGSGVKGCGPEREAAAVKSTVNSAEEDAVKGRGPEREDATVNGRARPAEHQQPTEVRVRVAEQTKYQRERNAAAAAWFAAKANNPQLTQREFAKRWGKSQPWLTKVIQEALSTPKAPDQPTTTSE